MKKLIFKIPYILAALIFITNTYEAAAATSAKKDIKKLLSKRNLLALPSLSSQVSTYTVKSSSTASAAATAPTLKSIPRTPIKDIFWRQINGVNVIDAINSPNPDKASCDEFFAGRNDGESGGLGACHMAENVGYSYSTIVRSGLALCYLKNMPSTKNAASGGLVVNSGSIAGSIEKLFSSPSGSTSRIVKVNVTGEQRDPNAPTKVFIEIPTVSANNAAKKIYQAKIWFCDESNTNVLGYDTLSISNSLLFTSSHAGSDDRGTNSTSAFGYLVKKGNNLIWDSTKARTAKTFDNRTNGGDFKSELEITKNSLIKLKRVDNFNDHSNKAFLITKYSGNSAEDLRFMNGAFADEHRDNTITSAAKFDNTFYATDTGNSYLAEVEKANLNEDFYTSSIKVTVDTSAYNCQVTPDIEVTMDTNNETIRNSVGTCMDQDLENMHFCHDDPLVSQAEENFKERCHGSGPPPTPVPMLPPKKN